MAEKRGSIAFFTTYRPLAKVDMYARHLPPQNSAYEQHLTDGCSYNYNGQMIPWPALEAILERPKVAAQVNKDDVDPDSGLVFVSERTDNLETLHIGFRLKSDPSIRKTFNFADIYDLPEAKQVRMEDTGCIAGDYLIYISTKEPAQSPRHPWTAIYRTHLKTGATERITFRATKAADLNPSVSPCGKKIAVAAFPVSGWNGKNKNLMTDIYSVELEGRFKRQLLVKNGGWPSWGSENIIFFHRVVDQKFRVFRYNIKTNQEEAVTPPGIEALTPAAIDEDTVAVATIRVETPLDVLERKQAAQYRHIEIFKVSGGHPINLTASHRPKADHFNPFVIVDHKHGHKIGYHRCDTDHLQNGGTIERESNKLLSPDSDIGLFRVSGVFPTFTLDGSKLAFVDNEFLHIWVADSNGLRIVHKAEGPDGMFSPVWHPKGKMLYVCKGRSFNKKGEVHIELLKDVSKGYVRTSEPLTAGDANNAFPSCNKDGTKFVFRSTRDHPEERHKNLYIMEDAINGEFGYANNKEKVRRITFKNCTDTHCKWSPNGDWIVFSSDVDRPPNKEKEPDLPDAGHFAVYLVHAYNPGPPIRVIGSGSGLSTLPGHVTHPFFSPDGKSIVFAADLAAVSVDPGSLPLFLHSVRPYGDIFLVDLNMSDIKKNKDIKKFKRITHSRYENSTPCWTMFSTSDPSAKWNMTLAEYDRNHHRPAHPYYHGGDSWHMTGLLCIPNRNKCC